jgi:hypothetical protein
VWRHQHRRHGGSDQGQQRVSRPMHSATSTPVYRRTAARLEAADAERCSVGTIREPGSRLGDCESITADEEASAMNEQQQDAQWNVAEWHGKMLVASDGERIGKLQDVYVDVENDEPQFATVKEGFINRHLTFVPLGGIKVGPDDLQVAVTKEQIKSAPNIEQHGDELSQADESALYHHYELNYTPPDTESGRRLARR